MKRLRPLLRRTTLAGAVSSLLAGTPAVAMDAGVGLRTLADHPAEMGSSSSPDLTQLLEQGHAAWRSLDFQLAARYYCAAARQGSTDAEYRLGRLLLQQRSVPSAQAQGHWLLRQAATKGHAEASQFVDEFLDPPATDAILTPRPQCLPEPAPMVVTQPLPEGFAELLTHNGEPVSPADIKRYLAQLDRERQQWAQLVQERAPFHGVDPRLALSLVRAESNFDPRALSPKNAQGLMQLIPATAARFGVRDPLDPRQNIEGGLAYLRWLLNRFDHDVVKAIAAYNAGEGAVDRHKGIPPYPETQAYVERILRFYRSTRHTPPPVPKARLIKPQRTPPRG